MSDKSRIGTLIAEREGQLYSEQQANLQSFQNTIVDIISDICKNMMYDIRDVYLIIYFDISFDNNDGPQTLQCKYCTTRELEGTENDIYHDANEIKCDVSKEAMEYFDARVISVEELARDFAGKKLGAYKFKFTADTVANSYKMKVTYILGSQKNKPTVH